MGLAPTTSRSRRNRSLHHRPAYWCPQFRTPGKEVGDGSAGIEPAGPHGGPSNEVTVTFTTGRRFSHLCVPGHRARRDEPGSRQSELEPDLIEIPDGLAIACPPGMQTVASISGRGTSSAGLILSYEVTRSLTIGRLRQRAPVGGCTAAARSRLPLHSACRLLRSGRSPANGTRSARGKISTAARSRG